MFGREILKSAVKLLTGACVTTLMLHMPAQAAEAVGPVRPPPPPPDLPGVTFTKDGSVIFKGGPEKGGHIVTKDGTLITKDFITTEKDAGGGTRVRTRAHRKTGMQEVCTKDPDGFVSQEARDKDGGVISRVGWSKNGKLIEYEPWVSDQIFNSAQRVLEARYHHVGKQSTVQFQSPGKVYPTGTSILVRNEYRERSGTSRELGKTSSYAAHEDIKMKTEIRKLKLDRNNRFVVMEVMGGTMQASGWGKTRDEAFASALEQIASEIMIHIRSEMIDYQATTRTRTAKGTTESGMERVEEKLDARSKAAFKAYRIVAVTRDGDQYTVNVEAVPGAVVSSPPLFACRAGFR